MKSTALQLDAAVVVWLNGLARRAPPWSRVAVGLLARWLAGAEIGLMLALALSGRRREPARMLAAVAVVYAASESLGRAWPRQRPFEREPSVHALTPHDRGRSFPSRHVASGLAMATIGKGAHARLGLLMSAVACALGLARVAAGLHYPSDILGGAALGLSIGRLLRPAS